MQRRVGDPVAGGFVANLAKPGGNATGFSSIEYAVSEKWPELLKQIAPKLARVAVLRDPEQISGGGQLGALQAVAQVLRVELFPIDVREPQEMKDAIVAFARQPNGGLISTTSALAQIDRGAIIDLATQLKLPAMYPYRFYIPEGGLISYGPDVVLQYRLAAEYVDRILRGAKPGDLPVQQPTNYLLVVNLKAANSIGLQVPESVLDSATAIAALARRNPNAARLLEHLAASHTLAEDAGKIAARATAKTLVLNHLVPSDDPTLTDTDWIAAARAHYAGQIVVARDLMEMAVA